MNAQATLPAAVATVGGTTVLARRLTEVTGRTVRHSTIHKWMKSRVPAEFVLAVEDVTGMSRHDLRPDVFGPRASDHAA